MQDDNHDIKSEFFIKLTSQPNLHLILWRVDHTVTSASNMMYEEMSTLASNTYSPITIPYDHSNILHTHIPCYALPLSYHSPDKKILLFAHSSVLSVSTTFKAPHIKVHVLHSDSL